MFRALSKFPRRLTRGVRAAIATCLAAFFVFLCVLKIEAMFHLPVHGLHPHHPYLKGHARHEVSEATLGKAPPRYDGPYHRYRQHNGRWTRMTGQSETVRRYYDGKPPPIPHVIHQTWDSANIPEHFVPWVLSWVKQHPKWEYWLWTPSDVTKFIEKDYPESLKTYEHYRQVLSRADAMRYFVLHSYGGVYADLDTQCLRPFDDLSRELPCILSEETYEHAHLLYYKNPPNLMTTIMACRPTHPLFLLALRGLPYTQKRYPHDVLKSTGPLYLDSIYRHFLEYFPKTVATYVKVVPPDYFLPTYDVSQSTRFDRTCHELRPNSPAYLKKTCHRWDTTRRFHNSPTNNSYATHFWIHVAMREKKWKEMKSMPIEEVINHRTKPHNKHQGAPAHNEQVAYEDIRDQHNTLPYNHSRKSGFVSFHQN